MKKLMMFAAVMAAGCVPNNTIFAPEDAPPEMEPDDEPDPDPAPCEPGFVGCEGDVAQTCGSDGLTVTDEECEVGCNAAAGRCNECAPDAVACDGDEIQHCGSDGLITSTESCTAGCTENEGAARCVRIVPAYLPNVCDTPATLPAFEVNELVTQSFDTDVNAKCNGGIIKIHPTGPEICVVRAGTISLESPLAIFGSRAIAFVADGKLLATSTLDVAARGSVSGPGGGVRVSGAAPSTVGGGASGGGAGGKQPGGIGGAMGDLGANAGAGGAISDPFVLGSFEGGARAGSANVLVPNYGPQGGGGGGALMMISCTDEVIAAGIIDAGGGGGQAGGDGVASSTVTKLLGGAGGGAGGYVVLQGAKVTVPGFMFANGGGGGGGCSGEGCKGKAGQDGAHSRARGGAATGQGTAGGDGSLGTSPPTNGITSLSAGSPGGGGGASGRFQVFTPAGVTPSVSTQPAFEPHRTIETR